MRELSLQEIDSVAGGNAYTDLGGGMGGLGAGIATIGAVAGIGVAAPGIIAIGAAWMIGGG